MYEVCNQLRKVSNHDLWLSILGLTDQFVHERVAPGQYAALQAHISGESIRLGNETRSQAEEALLARAQSMGQRALDAVVTKVGHIGDINDYRIPLLRHGTLYHALKHAPYVLARLETWTEGGKSKLRTLLTELGIATSDARQLFKVLSPESKSRLDASLEAKASDARYNLPDIRFKSFSRQVSPSLNFAAQDAVLALSALMELPHHDAKERYADWTREQGFWRAWAAADSGAASGAGGSSSSGSAASSASSSSSTSAAQAAATHSSSSSAPKVSGGGDATPNALLLRGVEQSMHLQKLVLDTVSWCLASKAVKPGGDFRYAVLPESADSIFLSRPAALQRLALALSEATKVARGSLMPLVLASPLPGGQGAHLVVAVLGSTLSPEVRSKNPFGLRFATAAVPDLPEFEEGEDDADEDDEARRIRLVEQADMTELARLRVTQEGFDSAHVEVKSEDLNTFIERLTIQGI
jgi:cell division control protein 45